MRKILMLLTVLSAMIVCSVSVYAYNVVDLPDTMTLSDALEIYDAESITSATVSNINDGQYISLTGDEIKDFYYSAANVMLHRTINPTPFRGTAINFTTSDGVKSFYFASGVQIGMYGSSNYICYEMDDYDLSKFMYICSLYEEDTQKQNGAEVYRNTDIDFLKLPQDLWARQPISEAASRSLLPYQLTSKYSADISREEFCMLIGNFIAVVGGYASLDKYMEDNAPGYSRDNFSDCIGRDSSIDMLFNLGIVSGTGGEYFNPDGSITREEAAKILTLAASQFKYIETNYPLQYDDASSVSPWATFYVRWVTDNGVMSGIDEAHFVPSDTYTVQQAVTTVSRLFNVCTAE